MIKHISLSRVMEKPAIFAVELLKGCIEETFGDQLRSQSLTKICVIADNGPHFAAYRFLDLMLLWFPNHYRCHTSTIFGPAYHMKSVCDATGGLLSHFEKEHIKKEKVNDLYQLKGCYDTVSARLHKEGDPQMLVSVAMPPRKSQAEAALKKIDSRTLPGTMAQCFEWTSVINDKRLIQHPQRSLLGKDKQLSGLTISCCKIPGDDANRTIANGTVKLCDDQSKEDIAIPDEMVDKEEHEAFLAAHCKEHLEWKVSYRKNACEELSIEKVKSRLSSAWRNFGAISSGMGTCRQEVDPDEAKDRQIKRNVQEKSRRVRSKLAVPE